MYKHSECFVQMCTDYDHVFINESMGNVHKNKIVHYQLIDKSTKE